MAQSLLIHFFRRFHAGRVGFVPLSKSGCKFCSCTKSAGSEKISETGEDDQVSVGQFFAAKAVIEMLGVRHGLIFKVS